MKRRALAPSDSTVTDTAVAHRRRELKSKGPGPSQASLGRGEQAAGRTVFFSRRPSRKAGLLAVEAAARPWINHQG